MKKNKLILLIKGAIYGHMLGESLALKKIDNDDELFYGQNTALSLCSMASFLEMDSINLEDISYRMQDWYIAGYMASNDVVPGPVTSRSIRNMINGMPLNKTGITEADNDTSESLGRSLASAIYCCTGPIDESIDFAHSLSCLTNAHINSQVCCAIYALIVRNLILGQKDKVTELLEDYYQVKKMSDHRNALRKIKCAHKIIRESVKELPNPDTDSVIAFWVSWDISANYGSDYFSCIKKVLDVGKRSLTAAAVTGSICGLTLGYNEIPRKLLRKIKIPPEASLVIEKFVDNLACKIPTN